MGVARTIKAAYNKSSMANFVTQGSFGATGVIEIYEEDNTEDNKQSAQNSEGGGQCPALTASYDKVSLANLMGVDSFPKPCCLTNENEMKKYRIRKLTPTECFRLMGCDDKTCDKLTKSGISNSQLYKMAGNSIVVDCLFHIFRQAFTMDRDEIQQPTLF